jgi:hypothetical protein
VEECRPSEDQWCSASRCGNIVEVSPAESVTPDQGRSTTCYPFTYQRHAPWKCLNSAGCPSSLWGNGIRHYWHTSSAPLGRMGYAGPTGLWVVSKEIWGYSGRRWRIRDLTALGDPRIRGPLRSTLDPRIRDLAVLGGPPDSGSAGSTEGTQEPSEGTPGAPITRG